MNDDSQIIKVLDELTLLGEVALAFSQISSTRMKRIRENVLTSRDFQFSVYEIFKEVLASYAREQAHRKKSGKITFLSHNGKTVALFLSANTGLYGDIVNKTFEFFVNEIKSQDFEVAIVGKLGLAMYKERFPKRPYTYFDLKDYGKDPDGLLEIIKHIVQYERVLIYYGKYENVVKQVPSKYDISAEVPLEGAEAVEVDKYIFEPNPEALLAFFESELFTSLFDHSVFESQLAKFASRMIAMDLASQKIEERIKVASLQSLRIGHATSNRKQQNALASIYYLEKHT